MHRSTPQTTKKSRNFCSPESPFPSPNKSLSLTAETLLRGHVVESTRRTCDSETRAVYHFCGFNRHKCLPAENYTVHEFLTKRFEKKSLLYGGSLSSSHLKPARREQLPVESHSALVCRAPKGYKNLIPADDDKRLLISLDIMRVIKRNLFSSKFPNHDKTPYRAAFSLFFFAFLQAGEFTKPIL